MSFLKVHLKQHTPIIHFQHDQDGATLRATELKPKLDKYLREYMPKKDETIRYQLKVKPLGRVAIYPDNSKILMYFGKNKKRILHSKGVELTINTYFDNVLEDNIKNVLPLCLALENFGARQSKGYGSFYGDHNETNWQIEKELKKTGKPVYYFDVPDKDNVFNYIDVLYKAMKSGINETFGNPGSNAYLKSFLWQYLNQTGGLVTWEKRFMKKVIKSEPVSDGEYFRALLGICDEFKFMDIHIWKNGKKRLHIKEARMDYDYADKGMIPLIPQRKFKVGNAAIKRFKSPITFKPVGKRIYIILNQDAYKHNETKLQGTFFKFQPQFKSGKYNFLLKVPDDFALTKFMNFVKTKVNKDNFGAFVGESANRLKKINIETL